MHTRRLLTVIDANGNKYMTDYNEKTLQESKISNSRLMLGE